jgi:hypothetical protein
MWSGIGRCARLQMRPNDTQRPKPSAVATFSPRSSAGWVYQAMPAGSMPLTEA